MRPLLRKPPQLANGPFFALWRRTEARIAFAWHQHEEFELVCLIRSRGTRFVGDSIEDYESGDLVLLGPGLPHSYASEPRSKLRGHEQVVVHFDRALIGPSLTDPGLRAVSALLMQAERGIVFGGSARAQAVRLLSDLPRKRPLLRFAGLLQTLDLLAHARDRRVLSTRSFAGTLRPEELTPVDKIRRLVEQSFQKGISADAAARHLAMSGATFRRFFQRTMGRSFTSYVTEMRIRHASHLLLTSELSVDEVARASGFASQPYFNRRFLELRGVRPGEYRRGEHHRARQVLATAT